MQKETEMGILQAIKKYFGMTMEQMKAEVLPLSEAEKTDLGSLCRDALKANERAESCVANSSPIVIG